MLTEKYLGVDIGGSSIKMALVDSAGAIHGEILRIDVGQDPLADLLDALSYFSDSYIGIGVGSPGYISKDRTQVQYAANLDWRNLPLPALIQGSVGKPTVLLGDAHAAAYAEAKIGLGRGHDSLVMLTLGTGVGMSVIANGEPLFGGRGLAGNIGHIQIDTEEVPCPCGLTHCWEYYAGGRGLERLFDAQLKVSAKDIFELAGNFDAQALGAIARWSEKLAVGIALVIELIDPEIVVLGGGISHAANLFVNELHAALVPLTPGARESGLPPIATATAGPDAGIIGAAMFAAKEIQEL